MHPCGSLSCFLATNSWSVYHDWLTAANRGPEYRACEGKPYMLHAHEMTVAGYKQCT